MTEASAAWCLVSSQHMGILGNQGTVKTVQQVGGDGSAELPPGTILRIRQPVSGFQAHLSVQGDKTPASITSGRRGGRWWATAEGDLTQGEQILKSTESADGFHDQFPLIGGMLDIFILKM